MTEAQIEKYGIELQGAFEAIQQPRSDFALAHFVVGEKDTRPAQYAQCVLELQLKHQAIRRAVIAGKRLRLEIERLRDTGDELDALSADEKEIDLEATGHAMRGAVREFETLHAIFQTFPRYTHDELQAAQAEYWGARLRRQAEQDLAATGRIGAGNQDALRQIGAKIEVGQGGIKIQLPELPDGASVLRAGASLAGKASIT